MWRPLDAKMSEMVTVTVDIASGSEQFMDDGGGRGNLAGYLSAK